MPKILIAVPVVEWRNEFVQTLLRFWTGQNRYPYTYTQTYRENLDVAQNKMTQKAVDGGFTHILFIEDDMLGWTKEDYYKLVEADKDIIGGAYYARRFPHLLTGRRKFNPDIKLTAQQTGENLYTSPNLENIQEMDSMGIGFTLIKTDIFKKLSKPWFNFSIAYYSDAYFYQKCWDELKIHPYTHFDIWINHNGVTKDNVSLYYEIGLKDRAWEKNTDKAIIFDKKEEYDEHIRKLNEDIKKAEEKRCLIQQ